MTNRAGLTDASGYARQWISSSMILDQVAVPNIEIQHDASAFSRWT